MNDQIFPQAWVPYYKPRSSAQIRLFCFPYGGGRALNFRSWLDAFPPLIEVLPIELPGRGTRIGEAPYNKLAPLIEALGRAIYPLLDRPFAFFGHSLGALISFELGRMVRNQHNLIPKHLFLSGCRPPQIPSRYTPTYLLPEDAFVARVYHLDGTPTEVLESPELMALMMPILRSDFEAFETHEYQPQQPLPCPFTIFGGLEDTLVTAEQMNEWRIHTTDTFVRRMFPGGHFFIQAHERVVIKIIDQSLSLSI
jgi:medium-chain acyl-[acyl-carrier-protein] hydrolase